ncbi:unnamed protein product [Lampetra fluviatilis]
MNMEAPGQRTTGWPRERSFEVVNFDMNPCRVDVETHNSEDQKLCHPCLGTRHAGVTILTEPLTPCPGTLRHWACQGIHSGTALPVADQGQTMTSRNNL